ncbi:MAG: hypothetical protein GDA44_15470 [Prochloron sp. SP5CPC1]|nr:hypothetical protein [Candidatus Paraprochloron terpiosi SP5CPC1]
MTRNSGSSINTASLDEIFNFWEIDSLVKDCCQIASQNPQRLYLFMQRYAFFNSFAGSLVARLASSIGLSHNVFVDPSCPDLEEADRRMDIAANIFAATVDEHSDCHYKDTPHRTLAVATLKAIGDFASLSEEQKNKLSQTPQYLTPILEKTIQGYQGVPGNAWELVKSMGFHAASEILASHEYTVIDEIIRYENQGQGFDGYLSNGNRQVTVNGQNINPWSWIVIHGNYKGSGVEEGRFVSSEIAA